LVTGFSTSYPSAKAALTASCRRALATSRSRGLSRENSIDRNRLRSNGMRSPPAAAAYRLPKSKRS
jgi:hypothetical protein